MIARGVLRFQLHNPFGTLAGEPMQLDQYLHAQEAGLDFLTQGFVEAWKPITDQEVEVIAYVGCGLEDPDFERFEQADDLEGWLARAHRALRPALDAGMSIGLDAAVLAKANSPTHVLAEQLRTSGVRVYIEAKPSRFTPHWFDFNVIALDRNWLSQDIETGHPQAQNYGIDDRLLTGEILRMAYPREGETWDDLSDIRRLTRAQEILNDGHSVSIGVTGLLNAHPDVQLAPGLLDHSGSAAFPSQSLSYD